MKTLHTTEPDSDPAFLRRYAKKLAEDVGSDATRDQVLCFADAYAEGWRISDADADFVLATLAEA